MVTIETGHKKNKGSWKEGINVLIDIGPVGIQIGGAVSVRVWELCYGIAVFSIVWHLMRQERLECVWHYCPHRYAPHEIPNECQFCFQFLMEEHELPRHL